jgi:hypothetical protein
LTEAQQDELFAVLQHMPYGKAVEWAHERLSLVTSVAGLSRWWKRESARRMREQIRRGLAASAHFDQVANETILDTRMRKALKDGFFQFVAAGDPAAALDFGKLALDANRTEHDRQRLSRLLDAERARDELRAQCAALEAQLAELTQAANAKAPAGLTPEGRKQVEEAMGVL